MSAATRALATLSVALAAVGCAVQQAQDPRAAEANFPVVCKDRRECDSMWERAQAWVAQNAGYKLRTVTDFVIQTEGPLPTRVEMAVQVVREPLPGGGASIRIVTACDNLFGCVPHPVDAKLAFKAYIQAIQTN